MADVTSAVVIFGGGWAGSSSARLCNSSVSSGSGRVTDEDQPPTVGGPYVHIEHLHGGNLHSALAPVRTQNGSGHAGSGLAHAGSLQPTMEMFCRLHAVSARFAEQHD